MFYPGKATPGLVMLNTLKQNSWWLAVTLAGIYQQGAVAPGAAAMVIAALVKAITPAVWLSLPQSWRLRLCNQLTSSRTKSRCSFERGRPAIRSITMLTSEKIDRTNNRAGELRSDVSLSKG